MALAALHGTFTGKYVLRAANTSGSQPWIVSTLVAGYRVVAANASSASGATLWTTYNASPSGTSGGLILQDENGLFLAVNNDDLGVCMVSSVSQAQPLLFSSLPTSASSALSVTCTRSSPSPGEMFYTIGSQPYLIFTHHGRSAPSSTWTAFSMSMVTPSLSAITTAAVGYDLRGVDLSSADLRDVDCSKARFDGALFDQTNVSGCTFTGATFRDTDLRGLLWGNSINASQADFTGSIGCGITNFPPSNPSAGQCANFSSSTLTGADFSGANLVKASFDSAVLYGANFSGATLNAAVFTGVTAGISGEAGQAPADFSGASLIDAIFNNAHLEGVTFAGAQAWFNGQGNFNGASLVQTDFSDADLTDVPFSGTKMQVQGCCFDRAILQGTRFTNVTFCPAADGSPVTMVGAHLEGAQFVSCKFVGVRLTGAWVAASSGGVPLLVTAPSSPSASAWIASLDQLQVPSGLAADLANAGYVLSASATVAVVQSGTSWSFTQSAVNGAASDVQPVGFGVTTSNGLFAIGCTMVSVSQYQTAGYTLALTMTVTPTAFLPMSMDAATRCPNGRTLGTNNADALSWSEMIVASRFPLP